LRQTDIALVHTGYMQGERVADKLERNLRLIDLDLESRPFDGHLLCSRAAALVDMERAAEALVTIGFWETAYAAYKVPASLRALKVRALGMEEDLAGALACARPGLKDFPGDSKLAFLEARILAALGEMNAAEQCLRAQLMLSEEHGQYAVVDRTIGAFRLRHLLAEVLLMQGRAHEAVCGRAA